MWDEEDRQEVTLRVTALLDAISSGDSAAFGAHVNVLAGDAILTGFVLHRAVGCDRPHIVEAILAHAASQDTNDMALAMAVQQRRLAIVQAVLALGTSADERCRQACAAASWRWVEGLVALLDGGVSLACKWSILNESIGENSTEVFSVTVEHGVSLEMLALALPDVVALDRLAMLEAVLLMTQQAAPSHLPCACLIQAIHDDSSRIFTRLLAEAPSQKCIEDALAHASQLGRAEMHRALQAAAEGSE